MPGVYNVSTFYKITCYSLREMQKELVVVVMFSLLVCDRLSYFNFSFFLCPYSSLISRYCS